MVGRITPLCTSGDVSESLSEPAFLPHARFCQRVQFRLYVVPDPFRVPPLFRSYGDPLKKRGKVPVIAHGKNGFACLADNMLLLDLLAFLNVDRA